MQKRPICNVRDCKNLAKIKSTKRNGIDKYYHKVCSSCYLKQKGRRPLDSKRKRRLKETPEALLLSPPFGDGFDNRKCARCGWNKGPCDRHHKENGNLVSLCPNCHRLFTLKILDDSLLDSL